MITVQYFIVKLLLGIILCEDKVFDFEYLQDMLIIIQMHAFLSNLFHIYMRYVVFIIPMFYYALEPVDVTITGLRSQDLGGIVIIECTATGKPQPTVEWKKDGVTLSLNVVNMATRDNNTNISTLTTSLASSDAGIYMCVGSNVIQNVVFNDTAIVNLAVTGSKSLTLLIMYYA